MRNKPCRPIGPNLGNQIAPEPSAPSLWSTCILCIWSFPNHRTKAADFKMSFYQERKGKACEVSGCLDSHPCGGVCTRSTVGLSLRQVNTYPMLDHNQQFPCNYHNPLSIPTDRTKAHGPSSQQGLCSLHHVCVWTVE